MRALLPLSLTIAVAMTSLNACRTSSPAAPPATSPATLDPEGHEPASPRAYLPRALRKRPQQAASAPVEPSGPCATMLAVYRCMFSRMPQTPPGTLARIEQMFAKMPAQHRGRFCKLGLDALRRSLGKQPQFASCL